LVREEEGDGVVAEFEFAEGVDGFGAGGGAEDAVVGGVLAPEVAIDRAEDVEIVVDGEEGGLSHGEVVRVAFNGCLEVEIGRREISAGCVGARGRSWIAGLGPPGRVCGARFVRR
jgi:hypothetical protein